MTEEQQRHQTDDEAAQTIVPQRDTAPGDENGTATVVPGERAAGQAVPVVQSEPGRAADVPEPDVEFAPTSVPVDSGVRFAPVAEEPDALLDTGRMSAVEQDTVIEAARGRAAAMWRSQERRPRRERHVGLWVVSTLALLVAVGSLALNAVLIQALTSRRAAVQSLMDDASAGLDRAAASGIAIDFPVKQTIHFEGDIPVQQDFDFPVNTTIAFNTTVRVPVDLGALGTIYVNVPIDTSVPVNTTVPVHVDQTIHVDTDIPIEMVVPIRMSPDEPPLKDLLDEVRGFLTKLEGLL
ncbi:MAG: hypothetical protein ACYC5O_03070 [Anaerolineae bacterium]